MSALSLILAYCFTVITYLEAIVICDVLIFAVSIYVL